MAVGAGAQVVPAIVIGAEESHLNLGSINFGRWLKGYRLPIPMNLVPLPAKWTIKFLSPMDVSHISQSDLSDKKVVAKEIRRIRSRMQRAINAELKKRKYIFHPKLF